MKSTPKKRNIEQYEHIDKDRLNNPEAGLVSGATDPAAGMGQNWLKMWADSGKS